MKTTPPILCVGSVLWDIIGRTPRKMAAGEDVSGRILRIPGGVAMNIAMALRMHDLPVSLLSALGDDAAGRELLLNCAARGMETQYVTVSPEHPTDQYMAIEGTNGLIAAIADAHSLEELAGQVISPLQDGRLGCAQTPYIGMVIFEGNLPQKTLTHIARAPEFSAADICLAPASPGKAERLSPFLQHSHATAYLNLIEANILLGENLGTSTKAATQLTKHGLYRAVVTDGPKPAAISQGSTVITLSPRDVQVLRVTGAGDVFMASHIAAEVKGLRDAPALQFALDTTAKYISTETPL
ncbi:MAG: kinase [Rhodobacteraceae bacterium]|nr:kinase [Paracoccaceae bacterium]